MNLLGQIVWQALLESRWLPSEPPAPQSEPAFELSPGEDLLPMLERFWEQADLSGAERRRGQRIQSWIRDQRDRGARLTVGLDAPRHERFRSWNGERLVWWPRGIPIGDRIGIVSSHLGRPTNHNHAWFRAFRSACARISQRNEVLLAAATATTHKFACRAAHIFGLRLLVLTPPRMRQDLATWLDMIAGRPPPETGSFEAHISPPLGNSESQLPSDLADSPVADRLLIAMSEQLLLMHLRRRGRLLPLIRHRLADPAWQPQSVSIVLGDKLTPRPIADELLGLGAVGWLILENLRTTAPSVSLDGPATNLSQSAGGLPSQIIPVPTASNWSFLTHCTRAPHGPWPDESREQFFDSLILSTEDADRSALATLRRILGQQRILATSNAIRGGAAVVSFTAVPVGELSKLRTFRVHRGRWDFEPYGICIQHDHLQQIGARPVLYGQHADWDRLSETDRPFFQLQCSEKSQAGESIDWSREREWRVLGDVDLRRVHDESAIVFVPSIDDARLLLPACRWPIVVLDRMITTECR